VKRFPGPFDNLSSDILAGMANLFWWDAWSSRQNELLEEGLDHVNLSGAEIAHVANNPSDLQRLIIEEHVKKVRKKIETANHAKLATLYKRAIRANEEAAAENDTPYAAGWRSSEDQFGSSLAHMSQRSGISWFDNNEKFNLEVPEVEWGACYLSWEDPSVDEALKAYLTREKIKLGDPEEILNLLTEFLNSKNLGGALHEFLISKTGGRR
jgi:hypothetical protein